MQKTEAIQLLGGTVSSLARACGITRSAVSQWPAELNKDMIDRVQAALWRKQNERKKPSKRPATDVK